MKGKKPILLLEDDKVHQMTIKRALRDLQVSNKLIIRENGLEGLEYLRGPKSERPSIILLDINMPKMNGIEFLQIVKKDEDLCSVPIVALTTSKEEQDRFDSFKFGVSGFMVKPVDYKQFVETVKPVLFLF